MAIEEPIAHAGPNQHAQSATEVLFVDMSRAARAVLQRDVGLSSGV